MSIRKNIAHDSFQPNRDKRRFFEVFANDRTGGIRINLAGREAKGIVQPGTEYNALCNELSNALREIRNAESGEPLIQEIMFVRDYYQGEYVDNLPDILVTWNRSAPIYAATSEKIGTVDARGISTQRTGDHRITGRFFAVSPSWPQGKLRTQVKTEDFFPTIARLLNVEPGKTDGIPISALLSDTRDPARKPAEPVSLAEIEEQI